MTYTLCGVGIVHKYRYGVVGCGWRGQGTPTVGVLVCLCSSGEGRGGRIGQDGFHVAGSPYATSNETLLTPGMEPEMRGSSHSEPNVREAWVSMRYAG
jgi:hypothetical protein